MSSSSRPAPVRRFKMPRWFYQFASPAYFEKLTGAVLPWLVIPGLLLFCVGLVWGLVYAPADYQQGDSFRIIYIHVPAAVWSMGTYMGMAITGAIGLIWRIKLAFVASRSCAPIGAALTFVALATGSLWGKPMWGTWWEWDARLTSELILLFLYIGYMALYDAIEDPDTAGRASALLAVVGVVNIPIIHYSVEWWNTLHQGATVLKFSRPSMAPEMLWPLLVMMLSFAPLIAANVLMRTRNEVIATKLERGDDDVF